MIGIVLDHLDARGVSYALIGGLAVNARGHARFTRPVFDSQMRKTIPAPAVRPLCIRRSRFAEALHARNTRAG